MKSETPVWLRRDSTLVADWHSWRLEVIEHPHMMGYRWSACTEGKASHGWADDELAACDVAQLQARRMGL